MPSRSCSEQNCAAEERFFFLEEGRGALAAEDMASGVCVLVLQLQDQF